MLSLSDWVALSSLVVSVAALVISVVALRISKEVVVYSSKDYEPQIDLAIRDEDNEWEVTVTNRSKKLFTLVSVSFIKVRTKGYEDYESNTVVRFPLLVESKYFRYIEGRSKAVINKDSPGPCAFQQCPINEKFVKEIEQKINKEYFEPFINGEENRRGYAFPSFQSVGYYVVVTYENKFKELKNAYFNKQHCHGTGYVSMKVTNEEVEDILRYIDIPKFEEFSSLWGYLVDRYKMPAEHFYK